MNAPSSETPRFVVLAGVDDTDAVHEVLRVAANFARTTPGGELHLVHVVEELPPPVSLVPAPVGLGETRGEIMGAARAHLEKLAGEVAPFYGREPTRHLAAGDACKEILQCAAELEADVILIGTHGRSGVRRMLLGSVAEGVVRKASCPVIVVREKDYPAEGKREPTRLGTQELRT